MDGIDQTSTEKGSCKPGLPILEDYLSSSPPPPKASPASPSSFWNSALVVVGIASTVLCSYKAYQKWSESKPQTADSASSKADREAAKKQAYLYAAGAAASAAFTVLTY